MIELVVAAAVIAGVLITVLVMRLFYQQKISELKADQSQEIKDARQDTRTKQKATTRGALWEKMAPYLPWFKYSPYESNFLGKPIDYIIFNNLSTEGGDVDIIFMDVKTGKSQLTPREKRIKEAVDAKRVRFETLRLPPDEDTLGESEHSSG